MPKVACCTGQMSRGKRLLRSATSLSGRTSMHIIIRIVHTQLAFTLTPPVAVSAATTGTPIRLAFRLLDQANSSFSRPTTIGMATGAKRGVYTANLCSSG